MSNNTNVPVINVPLLRKVMEHIEAHPEEWNQEFWVNRMAGCGTAYCFAGHAAHIMGCEWSECDREFVVADEADREWCEDHPYASIVQMGGEDYIHCSYRAERLLGLTIDQRTELFGPFNSLERLQNLVAQYEQEAYA